MRFEWDEAKNNLNLKKHKIDFESASFVFDDPHALSYQDRETDNEVRWQTMGLIAGGSMMILVSHADRQEDGEEVIRIISARKATPSERRAYEEGRWPPS
jgi:hypothetical protein